MDLDPLIRRILDILKGDAGVSASVKAFRYGELGSGEDSVLNSNEYPLVFVTAAISPEVSRRAVGPAESDRQVPPQERIYEIWAIIVTQGGTPEAAQKSLHGIVDDAESAIERNYQLRNADGDDPLCQHSEVHRQGRYLPAIGTMREAITLRIRPAVIVAP